MKVIKHYFFTNLETVKHFVKDYYREHPVHKMPRNIWQCKSVQGLYDALMKYSGDDHEHVNGVILYVLEKLTSR